MKRERSRPKGAPAASPAEAPVMNPMRAEQEGDGENLWEFLRRIGYVYKVGYLHQHDAVREAFEARGFTVTQVEADDGIWCVRMVASEGGSQETVKRLKPRIRKVLRSLGLTAPDECVGVLGSRIAVAFSAEDWTDEGLVVWNRRGRRTQVDRYWARAKE